MPNLQIINRTPQSQGFGAELGTALGQGVSEGISEALSEMLKNKANASSASSFADQIGLKGSQKDSFVGLLSKIDAKDQPKALEQMVTAQVLGNYLSQQQAAQQGQQSFGEKNTQANSFVPKEEEAEIPAIGPLAGLSKQQQTRQKIQQQKEQPIRERNLKLFDETNANIKELEDTNIGLQQLSKLSEKIGEKEGDSFFERLGKSYRFDPQTGGFTRIGKATSTPEEERYIKLIADQTKNIKQDYGARVTNFDIEVFLRRFPDLMMTKEGRKEILDTLNDYNEAKKLYNKTLKEELRRTKGTVDPYELDEIVESKIAEPLNVIKQRMINRGFSTEKTAEEKTPEQIKEITAVNPKTGQTLILRDGKWQLVR